MVIIREAVIKDFDSYINLYESLTEYHIQNRPDILKSVPGLTKSDFKKIIKNKDTFITVIEKDEEIIGFSKWQIKKVRNNPHLQERIVAFVDEFFIDFPFRRNGYGKKLWNSIVDIASKRGAQHIELYVWDFNENAQKFYESLGMTPQRTVMELKV